MAEHHATVDWARNGVEFTYQEYSRDHTWSFTGGVEVPASAAPAFLGTGDRVDPEEAFVASLASCHMLTFLAIAARKRYVVESYRDSAVGYLEKNPTGKLAVTRVILRPEIVFSGDNQPSRDEIAHLHHRSHHECFIAQSVRTEITVEAV